LWLSESLEEKEKPLKSKIVSRCPHFHSEALVEEEGIENQDLILRKS